MKRARRLSAEERALWRGVARSIKPLRKTPTSADAADGAPPVTQPKAAARIAAPAKPVSAAKRAPPPLAPLDRRSRQKLTRGSEAIDARLDLHGMTQAEAHAALGAFLRDAQERDARFVLVVTGKGARAADIGARGILRRQVPLWLGLPEFRGLVVGFEAAGRPHGGEGALYVRVRRGR